MGRDSILLRLMSRRANTLRDLKSAPGTFFTLKAMEVLLAPRGISPRKRTAEEALSLSSFLPLDPPLDLRIRKKREQLLLSSSRPACRILPEYSRAAWRPAMPAASLSLAAMTCFTLPAVS